MQAYWRASLREPDNTELSEIFPGQESDIAAWNKGQAWLLQTALPRMLEDTPAGDTDTVHHRAKSRFTDALLSETGDIVCWCDPWEMRLEHYPAE